MIKRIAIISLLFGMLLLLLALSPIALASAQTETPTPIVTATPAASYYTAQLSGGTLLIERRVTFGDLLVGFAALLVSVVIAATALPDVGNRIFKR